MTQLSLGSRRSLRSPAPRAKGPPRFATLRRILANPQGLIGAGGLALLVLLALGAELVAAHDPAAQDAGRRLLSPSVAHPFGVDELRRDLLARTLFGLRISLLASFPAVAAGALAGTALGFVAGYAGGWVEAVVMRCVDAMLAMPGLLSAIAVLTVLGPGSISVGVAIALFNVPLFTRLARGQMLAERGKEYVRAAEATGAGPARIIFIHIARNAAPPLLTQVAMSAVAAVMLAAALSFLGLGERPPEPSLGGLINASRPYLRTAWWYPLFPGLTLAVLLVSLNLLADAIAEATGPYRRR